MVRLAELAKPLLDPHPDQDRRADALGAGAPLNLLAADQPEYGRQVCTDIYLCH